LYFHPHFESSRVLLRTLWQYSPHSFTSLAPTISSSTCPKYYKPPSTKREDIKLTMGPYWRPYTKLWSASFFPWLPNCPTKMGITTHHPSWSCPETNFVSYYTHFEHVMDARRCIIYQINCIIICDHCWNWFGTCVCTKLAFKSNMFLHFRVICSGGNAK
jgi:hypothetical protein